MFDKKILKDSTLREGLDTPTVEFTPQEKIRILRLLDNAQVPEAEIVAPSRVEQDLEFVRQIREDNWRIKMSGLVYVCSPRCQQEMIAAGQSLDRFDLLMPLASKRQPYDKKEKICQLVDTLQRTSEEEWEVGAGFPHSTEVSSEFLMEIALEAVAAGAQRVSVYDTSGCADPFAVFSLIERLKEKVKVPVLFHAHNDLGLATANSLAAVLAGASALDVTINGLGDRAGNASLEQVAIALHVKGFDSGLILRELIPLSRAAETASGVVISRLAPIVGEYVFRHKSPSHLATPELFEAFDPKILGSQRSMEL